MKSKDYFDQWSKNYFKGVKYPLFLRWIFANIAGRLPYKKKAVILDLGTGPGVLITVLASKFKDAHFIGLDVSEGMIKEGQKITKRKKISAAFIVGKMHDLSNIGDKSVDYVVSNFAIHHCKAKEKMLKEIYRVLKPKGKMVFGDMFEKLDGKHLKEVSRLRKKTPKKAEQFDKSIQQTYDSLTEEEKKNHPKEFHLELEEYKGLISSVGFRKVNIVHSVNGRIAVIEAIK